MAPGGKVTYTVTLRNPGSTDYAGADFNDDLTKVLDDGTYNKDAKASSGKVAYKKPKLSRTGDVAAGKTVTVTYPVKAAVRPAGDRKLTNVITSSSNTNCPVPMNRAAGVIDKNCTTTTPVTKKITVIKKDARTGARLHGAVFELWRESSGKAGLQYSGKNADIRIGTGCATDLKETCTFYATGNG
ncbi:DUF7927 domain-containing protein [Streptomyces sp. NBC_01304]|uniref:DUF7927 domain-containing protein n=1 Tax=Streptomyces sp. NBC_01304 TaxID=2903818 RepID=UPI002E1238DD|nr:hypothetical protein OG430_42310 [Streptomyces sp. NBC_01304]